MIISTVLVIILWVAAGALLLTAALSPLETLSWWAGWSEDEVGEEEQTKTGPDDQSSSTASPGRVYIVYLSGIATLSGRYLLRREKLFLQGLKTRLPDAAVISDVFPYSPAGVPLLESPRVFDRVWRGVQKLKIQRRSAILSGLINMRNIFQVMVSADHRYGPIFNQGAAHVIEQALLEAGYERNSGAPVTVIGYSGGGQIGVGAATFLSARLAAPVDVISIGGVIASGPGLAALRRLTMIYGPRDTI
ncbi:MAG: CAAX protease, partial [Pseudomonadota bacterium]